MSVLAETGSVPVRSAGVELLGEVPGSGYRKPPALARRADGQTVSLTPLLYLVLSAIDGKRSYVDIAERVSTASGRLISPENVHTFVEKKLRPLGLVLLADGSEPKVRKTNPLLGLRFRFVVSNPKLTSRITAPFTPLFNPLLVTAFLLAFAAVSYWVLFDKGLASAAYQAFNQPALLLAIFAITVASAGFHEFGHAAAARRGGATPGAMGAGLYLVWPAFYTDVTDSYRLGRAGRIRTDLGGLYFNAVLAVVMWAAWLVTGWDALLLVIATQVLQMIRQLTPLVRYDGYHVLADLTGVPDLYHRIKPTLLGLLPHRWRHPETTALKPWARAVVTVWVLLVVPLLLLSSLLMILALPRVLATGWASLGREWNTLSAKASELDLAAVLAAGLALVAISLPMLGVVYMATRLAKRIVGGTWRATRGKPARRAGAGLALAGILAGLAWAWWPNPQTYQPIQPNERGTVRDVVHRHPAPQPHPAVAPVGLTAGHTGSSHVAWPKTAPQPTKAHPALALVLKPAAGQPAAPTWVFPFNPPKTPRPGDNQALAINTKNGSVVYDVAFSLVWVTDGSTVDQHNEAWALADCQDCATVAVAFQVILVVGQANVIIPQNVAVAVNYGCAQCLTVALAKQLVITLPGPLSEAGMAALAEVWNRLMQLGQHIQDLSLQQLQAELTRLETEILDIIRNEAPIPATASAPPTTRAPPSTGGSSPAPSSTGETTSPQPPTTSQPPSTTPEPTTTTPEPPTTTPSG